MMTTRAAEYDNIYQHDGSANPSYAYNSAQWYANVFKAKGAGKNNEELTELQAITFETKKSGILCGSI